MRNNVKESFNLIKKDLKRYLPGLIIFTAYYLLALHFFKSSCPMVLLVGLPCPGCGLVRGFKLILTFRFAEAFLLNPSSFIWFFFVLWLGISRYIIKKPFKRLNSILFILVAVFTIGIYLYGMITCFPNKIPYVYTRHNLTYFLLHRH